MAPPSSTSYVSQTPNPSSMAQARAQTVSEIPRPVRLAAMLVVAYGLTVLIGASVQQSISGWEYWRDFPRAVVRCGGAVLVAYGLLRRARWAWWTAVVGGGVLVFFGALGIVTFMASTLDVAIPISFLVGIAVGCVLLTVAVIALLRTESRESFRARAG